MCLQLMMWPGTTCHHISYQNALIRAFKYTSDDSQRSSLVFWVCGWQQQLPAQLLPGSFSCVLLFVICVVLWFVLQLSDVRVPTVHVTINNLGQLIYLYTIFVITTIARGGPLKTSVRFSCTEIWNMSLAGNSAITQNIPLCSSVH